MDKRAKLRGLYAITDNRLTPSEELVEYVAQAIQGGAAVIQYRDKSGDPGQRMWEAQDLLSVCRPFGVPLIINDDVELAAHVGADGVHLGREDGAIEAARARLGPDAIIGASCYNDLALAHAAAAAGADYVAFGSFNNSGTKPNAVRATPELLVRARAELDLPIVAIGGINAQNGWPLIEAGADMLAVVHAVFGMVDIPVAARAISLLFDLDNASNNPSDDS